MKETLSSLMSECRRGVCTSFFVTEVKTREVAMKTGSINMFCQCVSRILGSRHLLQCKIFRSHFILYPQIGYGKVPHLAEATPPANAYGGCGICEYSEREGQSEV